MYISPGLSDRPLDKDCRLPGWSPSEMDHAEDWIFAGCICAAQRPFAGPLPMRYRRGCETAHTPAEAAAHLTGFPGDET